MPVDADREMISSHAHGARDSREKEREREKRGGHESKNAISSLTYEPKSRFILIILHEIHVRFRRPRVGFCRSRSLHSIDRRRRRHLVVYRFQGGTKNGKQKKKGAK